MCLSAITGGKWWSEGPRIYEEKQSELLFNKHLNWITSYYNNKNYRNDNIAGKRKKWDLFFNFM